MKRSGVRPTGVRQWLRRKGRQATVCRVRTRDFPPVAASVPDARRWVSALLDHWELADEFDAVALLTSELVTNAVIHARSPLVVTVTVADSVLEIGVGDQDPRAPRVPDYASRDGTSAVGAGADLGWLQIGGRGLRLVDAYASEWGIATVATGKQVWFRQTVDESWPHRSACPCHGADLSRTRLESGRFAVALPGPWDASSP